MKWQDVLAAIREGKSKIPTAPNGTPLVSINAPFYEIMELMEALTTGYNELIQRSEEDQRRIERIRKLARAHFPAARKRESSGWIRVSDMLPVKSGLYMTYSDLMGVYPFQYSQKNMAFNSVDEDHGEHAVAVEYWHPSPLPPAKAAESEKED